ncbi:7534_t:CDS:2 [Ambispora gerdemannii]|uniref:7534_t:CDS:1 n=1 Tax=Ambispora gerdemannii TaxID=144530 RepID=A0A9N9F1A3_9GLOM|nr:7534_t:CDS:2 [Ambispora gerdemannii]
MVFTRAQKRTLDSPEEPPSKRKPTTNFPSLFEPPKTHLDSTDLLKNTEINKLLLEKANINNVQQLERYLRVEKYGKGDMLLGARVPDIRKISTLIGELNFNVLRELLQSSIHEKRLLALVNLVTQYQKNQVDPNLNTTNKDNIFKFYMEMREGIDNWDLVDTSASQIVGVHLYNKNEDFKKKWIYETLAVSPRLWDRRIAIVATRYFVARKKFDDTLKLAEMFIEDSEELVHKATGWVLREYGDQDMSGFYQFLNKNAARMPRIMYDQSTRKIPETMKSKYRKMRLEKANKEKKHENSST